MTSSTVILLKPVIYFALLLVAARFFRSPERPTPRPLHLGLLALGRVLAGIPVGTVTFLGVSYVANRNAGAGIVGLAIAGWGLWFAVGKLGFRGVRAAHLAVFAIAAEAVSLGMDFWMSTVAGHFRMC